MMWLLQYVQVLVCLCVCALLVGCGESQQMAPVVESNWRATQHEERHVVSKGETLYSIAFRYDEDYRRLAKINNLHAPYTVYIGQVLSLHTNMRERVIWHANPVARLPAQAKRVVGHKNHVRKLYPLTGRWLWPVHGRIVSTFVPAQGQKGINIAGSPGDKICAASSGVVAYAGNGLTGYGNLIIIKHNNNYMTAYGNNLRNLVREGQVVQAGQVIANIGVVDRRYWGVHFEIRRLGQPVNPMQYLGRSE